MSPTKPQAKEQNCSLKGVFQPTQIDIYIDGGARGNPGPAGTGVVILDDKGQKIDEFKEYIGHATNNTAEYRALISGLQLAKKYIPCSINVFTDSELIYRQMTGSYKVKNENLKEYFITAHQMLSSFEKVDFKHVPREQNKLADKLVNQAINIGSTLETGLKER
ncbi:MAG: ribonuclease HI family protein [Elusimicrobiota bacterium]